jgi:hypothetical protein
MRDLFSTKSPLTAGARGPLRDPAFRQTKTQRLPWQPKLHKISGLKRLHTIYRQVRQRFRALFSPTTASPPESTAVCATLTHFSGLCSIPADFVGVVVLRGDYRQGRESRRGTKSRAARNTRQGRLTASLAGRTGGQRRLRTVQKKRAAERFGSKALFAVQGAPLRTR